jgi:peroxiredoxin
MANNDGFVLEGELKGIEDSTWIFLDLDDTKDSSLVINRKFSFSGKVDNPKRGIIATKGYTDYKFLWVENAEMAFEAEKGSFREAKVSGSSVQDDANVLFASQKQLYKRRDSIVAVQRSEGLSPEEGAVVGKQLDKIRKEEKQLDISFIRENPGSLVSSYILDTYKTTWGKEKTEELYSKLSDANKKSEYGKSISEFISLNKEISVGDKFADFSQENVEGKQIRLSDLKGKVVLLEFWASWCGPCRRENPMLVKTYQSFKNKGFEIFAVSLDDSKENWLKAIKKDGLSWKNVSELNGDKNKAALIYGISGIPDNFLIDKEGTIIARNLRGEKLREKLQEILN